MQKSYNTPMHKLKLLSTSSEARARAHKSVKGKLAYHSHARTRAHTYMK